VELCVVKLLLPTDVLADLRKPVVIFILEEEEAGSI